MFRAHVRPGGLTLEFCGLMLDGSNMPLNRVTVNEFQSPAEVGKLLGRNRMHQLQAWYESRGGAS